MKRTVYEVPMADNKTRFRVRLEGDPCEPDRPQEYLYHQRYLLSQIAENPALTTCGFQTFQTLKIYFNGMCWVADAEAVVLKEPLNAVTFYSGNSPQA